MHVFYRGALALSAAAALTAAALACADDTHPTDTARLNRVEADEAHTMGSGTTSKLLGRALFDDDKPNFKVKRESGGWQMEIKAKPAFDLAVQSISFAVGSQSGWHRHPGPVLIQVVKGEMTFYESDDPNCTPIRKKAGEAYLDAGDDAHIARNESTEPAENIVTYFAPPGADLRIDAPRPGNCPF
jgi:quercetin dioxygenase-like cupin family protein